MAISKNELQIILTAQDKATKTITDSLNKVKKKSKDGATAMQADWKRTAVTILSAAAALKLFRIALNLLVSGAKFEQLSDSFATMARSMNFSAEQIISDMKRMSGETLTTAEIMQKASAAIILGIDPTRLSELMGIARASARALGKDVSYMFESLVTGIGRQSRLMLDNLGIIVSVTTANEKYAQQRGITLDQMSDQQKRQAFLNEALSKGKVIVDNLNVSEQTNAERIQEMGSAWTVLADVVGKNMVSAFNDLGLTSILHDLAKFLDGTTSSKEELDKLTQTFTETNDAAQEWIEQGINKFAWEAQAENVAELSKQILNLAIQMQNAGQAVPENITDFMVEADAEKFAELGGLQDGYYQAQNDKQRRYQEEQLAIMLEGDEIINALTTEAFALSEDELLQNNIKKLQMEQERINQKIQMAKLEEGIESDLLARKKVLIAAEVKLRQKAFDENIQTTLSTASTMLGMLSQTLQMAQGETEKYAGILQAVRIGETIINTATAVMRVYADMPIWIAPAMAAVVMAMGAAQVGIIASQGFAEGTDTVPAMLSPGEMVFPSTMADAIRRGDISVSGRGIGQTETNNRNVSINIEINNPVVSQAEDIDDLVNEISNRITEEAERI